MPFPQEVDGGVIVRNDTGYPTGWCYSFLECCVTHLLSGMLIDNAQDLVKQPKLTEDDLVQRFRITVSHALAHGLTSIHDAGLDPTSLAFFTR